MDIQCISCGGSFKRITKARIAKGGGWCRNTSAPGKMLRWFIEFVIISLTTAIIVVIFGAFAISPVFLARLMLGDDYFTTYESDL